MQHQLIRQFAIENFGPSYYVVPLGHSTPFQPLTLVVRESKGPMGKLKRKRMVVMDSIDLYLVEDRDVQSEVAELKKKNLINGEEHLIDKDIATRTSLTLKVDLVYQNEMTAKHNVNLGKLDLGKVQEEYYSDMGVRLVLAKAKLDRTKMQPYEKKKLYLITGVVYSSKLEISGERDSEDEFDASVGWPRFNWFKTRFSLLSRTEPPPALGRRHRSPLLFTYAKVKYDPERERLELKEMVGAKLKTEGIGFFEDVVPDNESTSSSNSQPLKCFVTKEDVVFEDLMESSISDPEVKLVTMTTMLQECDTFEAMKNKMSKYTNMATKALAKNGKEVTVEDPLTSQDHELLQSMGFEVSTIDLNSPVKIRVPREANKDNIYDFINIFQIFLDMKETEWMKIKEFVDKDKLDK